MTEGRESTELATELAMEATSGGPAEQRWRTKVAFTTLVLALFAATSALFAGISSHEILIDRTEEIVDVAVANSDLQRVEVLRSKHEVMLSLGVEPDPTEVALADQLEAEALVAITAASESRTDAFAASSAHQVFAIAATLFAIGITIAGLALIVDKNWLWWVSLSVGGIAVAAMVTGLVSFYG